MIVNEAPPSREAFTISATCCDFEEVNILVNSGIRAAARVPQLMIVASFHQNESSNRRLRSMDWCFLDCLWLSEAQIIRISYYGQSLLLSSRGLRHHSRGERICMASRLGILSKWSCVLLIFPSSAICRKSPLNPSGNFLRCFCDCFHVDKWKRARTKQIEYARRRPEPVVFIMHSFLRY